MGKIKSARPNKIISHRKRAMLKAMLAMLKAMLNAMLKAMLTAMLKAMLNATQEAMLTAMLKATRKAMLKAMLKAMRKPMQKEMLKSLQETMLKEMLKPMLWGTLGMPGEPKAGGCSKGNDEKEAKVPQEIRPGTPSSGHHCSVELKPLKAKFYWGGQA